MKMQAYKFHMVQCRSYLNHLLHVFHGDAELVFRQSRGDVGMCMGTYVGIDTEGNSGDFAFCFGKFVDDFQFGDAFYIEICNTGINSQVDFPIAFADSGKDNPAGRETSLDTCFDFSTAYTVGPESGRTDDA